MHYLFLRWSYILHGCRWILVEFVWFVRWNYWFGGCCITWDDLRHIHLRTQEVSFTISQDHNTALYKICIHTCAFYISTIFIFVLSCRFTQDIEDMTGYRPGPYWQITWRYLAPIIMFTILVSSIVFRIVNNPKYQAWHAELVSTYTNIHTYLSCIYNTE